jgi:serine/threonine protein kinase
VSHVLVYFVHIGSYCRRYQRGVVHGGLKPTNILIAYNGQACVADFGMFGLEPSGSVYSHRYFSPEAWRGVRLPIQRYWLAPLGFWPL